MKKTEKQRTRREQKREGDEERRMTLAGFTTVTTTSTTTFPLTLTMIHQRQSLATVQRKSKVQLYVYSAQWLEKRNLRELEHRACLP